MTCKNCFAFNRMQREKERLLAIVKRYATAARAIALHLDRFCNRALPYDEMIADAARKAGEEIDRQERQLVNARVISGMHEDKLKTAGMDAVKEFAKYLLDNYASGGVISAVDVVDAVVDWGTSSG